MAERFSSEKKAKHWRGCGDGAWMIHNVDNLQKLTLKHIKFTNNLFFFIVVSNSQVSCPLPTPPVQKPMGEDPALVCGNRTHQTQKAAKLCSPSKQFDETRRHQKIVCLIVCLNFCIILSHLRACWWHRETHSKLDGSVSRLSSKNNPKQNK